MFTIYGMPFTPAVPLHTVQIKGALCTNCHCTFQTFLDGRIVTSPSSCTLFPKVILEGILRNPLAEKKEVVTTRL